MPDKNWKFSLSDTHERSYRNLYMTAYEACLSETGTRRLTGRTAHPVANLER